MSEKQVVPLPSSNQWEARESLRGEVNVRKNLNFYLLLLIVSHDLSTRQVRRIDLIYKVLAKKILLNKIFVGRTVKWERII